VLFLLCPREGCEVLRSAFLCVCLFARISQKLHNETSRNFLYMLPVTVAQSFSDVNAICYVLPALCISYRSSAGQRKHADQRPMLYRWTTQPRNSNGGYPLPQCVLIGSVEISLVVAGGSDPWTPGQLRTWIHTYIQSVVSSPALSVNLKLYKTYMYFMLQ